MTINAPGRRRDSIATRLALLEAARELFGSRGFDGTSLRDIGEAVGVDASLIARYFGNKVSLYIAALEADRNVRPDHPDQGSVTELAHRMLNRVERHGVGPLLQAIVRNDTDPEIRELASSYLRANLVKPLADRARQAGVANPDLQAELTLATIMGIVLLRAGHDLPAIASASIEELVEWATARLQP